MQKQRQKQRQKWEGNYNYASADAAPERMRERKHRRRSGKFDSASNMLDDTAQSQQVCCISSPKMGQPIKRQVQGDRRFRRRQQRRDSNSSSTKSVKWNFDDSRNICKANESYLRAARERDSDINCEPPPKLQCNRWIVFWQSRVQANLSASERITSHDICVISVRNSN